MDASMLEETIQTPNPYPVVAKLEYDDIWQLCLQARDLAWNPVTDIDWASLTEFARDLPEEVRLAGAEWWSLRAWMEHGATPYGAQRYCDAVNEHLPFEVKQHVVNFIAEELRHHEASFRVADALGGYQPIPRSDYFQMVIPKFHDEKDEKAMPFYAGMAVNTLFEQFSGELLTARYKNARHPAIKEACRLILRDEARHMQFGRILMRRFFETLTRDQKAMLGIEIRQKAARQLAERRLRGGQPAARRTQAFRAAARQLAAEHGLGATFPDEEVTVIAEALAQIRKDVAPYDVPIPIIKEIEGDVAISQAAE